MCHLPRRRTRTCRSAWMFLDVLRSGPRTPTPARTRCRPGARREPCVRGSPQLAAGGLQKRLERGQLGDGVAHSPLESEGEAVTTISRHLMDDRRRPHRPSRCRWGRGVERQAAAVAVCSTGSNAWATIVGDVGHRYDGQRLEHSAGTSSRSGSSGPEMKTFDIPGAFGASELLLHPTDRQHRPFSMTSSGSSDVRSDLAPVAIDTRAVTIVTPGGRPVLGTAPAGTWT